MTSKKISQLTANTNPNGNEEFVYAYNNANGKITLDTMKTYIGSGGGSYTAGTGIDITAGVISNTGVTSVNGQTGDVTVSGGGGSSSYDAIVDANGGGDYTTIGAAINAGNYNIFVKNGSYTETVGRDPYTNNSSLLHIIGESESGVQITMPSTMTTTNHYMIDMRYNGAADFYMENLSFNITLTTDNSIFYRDEGGSNFIVKNCSFTYDTNVSTPSSTTHFLFYTKVLNDDSDMIEPGRNGLGLYGCYFNTETTKIINICRFMMYANQCKFYSVAGRIQLVVGDYSCKLNSCYISTYQLGGTYSLDIYDSYITISNNIYNNNGHELNLDRCVNSIVTVGTLQDSPSIGLALCTGSKLDFGSYDITAATTYNGIQPTKVNCRIMCGQYMVGKESIGCDISATSLRANSFTETRIVGCRFRNTLTNITLNGDKCIMSSNIFEGTGTMTITGDSNIINGNVMVGMSITDSGTGNVKANNITA